MMTALEQLRQLRLSLPPATAENVDVREEMLDEARKLLLDLEREDNVVERLSFQVIETITISAATKMGLFKVLDETTSSSTNDIAAACKADPVLVGRLLRCLASYGAVQEKGRHQYGPTKTSHTFTKRNFEAIMVFCLEFLTPIWLNIPSYLEENGWQNPTSQTSSALQKAWNTPGEAPKPMWELLPRAGPRILDAFNVAMSNFNAGHKEWSDFYPVLERLGQGASQDPSAVMMVDVGGGLGHQAAALKHKFPKLPGRFIVQDLAQSLPSPPPEGVEVMEHDFFTEQPIKGARCYYLRYITHDWSQELNVQICTRLREAMTPGYSRLIVNDWIVPETNASKFMAAQDLNLMTSLGGMERTLPLHREYLEKAGLKITRVFYPGDRISEGVIEAEVS